MNVKKALHGKLLNYQQKRVDKAYEKHGLTDEILDRQIEINQKRHRLNIPETDDYVQ